MNALREAIGEIGELRLRKRCGGRKIYVPISPKATHWLAQLLGMAVFCRLTDYAGGCYLSIRKPPKPLHQRNLNLMDLWQTGVSPPELAGIYDLTERHIYRIIRRYKTTHAPQSQDPHSARRNKR